MGEDNAVNVAKNTRAGSSNRAGKSYASRGERRTPYVTRLPEGIYEALMEASMAIGVSANVLVADALTDYVAGPAFARRLAESADRNHAKHRKIDEAARCQREAIERLSGR